MPIDHYPKESIVRSDQIRFSVPDEQPPGAAQPRSLSLRSPSRQARRPSPMGHPARDNSVSRGMSYYGIDSTYAATLAILRRVHERCG